MPYVLKYHVSICACLMMKFMEQAAYPQKSMEARRAFEQLIPKDLVGSQDGGSGKATDSV